MGLLSAGVLGLLLWASAAPAGAQPEPAAAADAVAQQTAAVQEQLKRMRIGDLLGRTVIDDEDREVGEIEKIVRDRYDQTLAAVVSTGGILGLGESQVPVPIDTLELREEQLVTRVGMIRAQVEEQAAAYTDTRYAEVNADLTVAAALSEGEHQRAGTQLSFEQLDQDGSGDINQIEAQESPLLRQSFNQADTNNDDAIDRGEFSAFEPETRQ